MAALCHHFVQNAWKKDLCSNCFKSKEEHSTNGSGAGEGKTRYLATMFPSRASWRQNDTAPQGILKDGQRVRRSKGSAVHFPTEESQVIGFGGDEFCSSDGEDNFGPEENGTVPDDDVVDGEEERALQKLTRNNTDFNTVAANLSEASNGETKRIFTQLLLGKPLTDAEGRRKTLQVSVTPFGGQEDSDASSTTSSRKSHLGKVLHEQQEKTKKITQSSFGKHSEIPKEKSGDIVLKSVVKNIEAKQEITSGSELTNGEGSLKQSENGTKIILTKTNGILHQNSRDIILKSLIRHDAIETIEKTAAGEVDENNVNIALQDTNNKTKEAEVVANKTREISLKLVSVKNVAQMPKETGENTSKPNENEASEGKVSRIPVIKSRVSPEKLKAVSRTTAFHGRSDLSGKPDEILPKPAVRKSSYESIRKIENIVKKDSANLVVNGDGISKDVNSDSDQSLKLEDSSKQSFKNLGNKNSEAGPPSLALKSDTKLPQGFENVANRKNLCTETISKSSNVTEVVHKGRQNNVNSTDAVLETHNMEVKELTLTQTTVESQGFVNLVGDVEKKPLSLNFCNTEGVSKEISECQISPLKNETCQKLSDELVKEKETIKDATSFPVRKIEGESSLNTPINSMTKTEGFADSNLTNETLTVDALLIEKDVEMFCVEESRELAGEPDGRADPDELTEPPALPRSPPPVIDPRPSFLHALTQVNALRKPTGDKPKIPVKPSTKVLQATPRRHVVPQSPKLPKKQEQSLQQDSVTQLQTSLQEQDHKSQQVLEVSSVECDAVEQLPQQQQELAALETARAHKRQAPKPPPVPVEDVSCPLFTRNPSVGLIKSSSPVTREKEKRERASSCSPKLCGEVVSQSPSGVGSNPAPCPEPAPRRSLSLSVESLTSTPPVATPPEQEKKKSSQGRARFSLRKFLRFGSGSKEDKNVNSVEVQRVEDVVPSVPVPRPRLEIIHPSELNGSNVEVVRGDSSNVRQRLEDSSSTNSSSSDNNKDSEASFDCSTSQLNSPSQASSARPAKPPPPPRNQSLDAWGKAIEGLNKPARPPPPKSAELLRQQKQPTRQMQPISPINNLYANLGLFSGEVRSGLTPSKPQRTSSIRDANTEGPKRRVVPQTEDSGYESVELSNGKHVSEVSENVYECLSPASDSETVEANTTKTARYNCLQQRRSEGSMETSPDFIKFRGSFVRSASLPYCGSETESDVYSPYSFYGGSEDAGDDDSEWSPSSGHPWKTSKLRSRKGRSVVHKNLEDNYGAVIVANHEALAQVLEQVNVGAMVPPALRGLKAAVNLRWMDFALLDDSRSVVVGRRSFHSALWGGHGVTLSLTADQCLQNTIPSRGCFTLCPLTEFSDLVPAHYLAGHPKDRTDLVQACVVVLTRMQVDTIHTYGTMLRSKVSEEERWRDGSFVLLQLVNGLKSLQAQGIEESPLSLSSFVLCREERDPQPRLCVLQALGMGVASEDGSLCQCALAAMHELLHTAPLTSLVSDLLHQERAVSLSQVKSVLEFSLWGPADVALGAPSSDRELVLQRWLDLERATVLHGLVRTRVELMVFEECHLLFLVRTSAKMMCEASVLLDSNSNSTPETTSF